MLRKYALFVGVAALGALVTSCGGGDGNPTPTPTPTGTATATPTPTPTPSQVDFDLSDDFATQSTNANYVFAYFTPAAGGDETFNGASRLNGPASIDLAISPELVTFEFADLPAAVTFDDGDFDSVSTTLRRYVRGDESLTMELPFEHVLRVSYEAQADYTRNSVAGVLRGERVSLFFNPVTTTAGITTDLVYDGSVDAFGGDPGTTLSDAITAPDITFTVNEADDSISGTIRIFEDVNGTPELVATLVLKKTTNSSGTVTGGVVNANGTFSGVITDSANDFEGTYAGALSGPNREEVFILFSISGDANTSDDRRYVGSYIGRR